MMDEMEFNYDIDFAASWIRGHSLECGIPEIRKEVLDMPFDELGNAEKLEIFKHGREAGLKLHAFKVGNRELPRVRKVLGFLRSIQFETLLDVGSGRGVFLLPLLREFPWVNVTSMDLLDRRVEFLTEMSRGGISRLSAVKGDVCDQPFPEASFDIVTMLEVLEHIPDVKKAFFSGVRMAKRFVVVSVPSKEDDNPEHIHLLTRDRLESLCEEAGCITPHFDWVNGHLIMVAGVR